MLSTTERLLFLRKLSIFEQVRSEYLFTLAHRLEETTFDMGAVVIRENDIVDSMYIVVSGLIRVESGGRILAKLGPGECVAELAVLDAEPASATVVVEEESLLLALDARELFEDIMAGQIEVARGLIKVITRRLRKALQDANRISSKEPKVD